MDEKALLVGIGVAILASFAGHYAARRKGRQGAWGAICFFLPPMLLLLDVLPTELNYRPTEPTNITVEWAASIIVLIQSLVWLSVWLSS